MKVEDQVTLDEIVDVQMRALARSRVARRWRWSGVLPTSLLAGGCLFVLIPESFNVKLVFGVLGALGAGVSVPLLYPGLVKKRIRNFVREQLGDDEHFPVEYEISPEGIHTKQIGADITFAWNDIEEIKDDRESIEFCERHGGIVVVRKRAFQSSEALSRFLQEARDYKLHN